MTLWIIPFAMIAYTFVFMLQAKGKQPPIEETMAKEIKDVTEQPVRNKFMCHRKHVLKRTKADGTFMCDVCEAPIAEGINMMFCHKCDYSVCFACHWPIS